MQGAMCLKTSPIPSTLTPNRYDPHERWNCAPRYRVRRSGHRSRDGAMNRMGYAATVTVDTPTFERELKDKDLWAKPVSARFHFRLKDGKVIEVSEGR